MSDSSSSSPKHTTDRDEGSRGLLSSTHSPRYGARYLEPVGRIWPQMKSIVIENSPTPYVNGDHQPLIYRKTVGPGLTLASNARSRPTHSDHTCCFKTKRKSQDGPIRPPWHRRNRRPVRPSFDDHRQSLAIAGPIYVCVLHCIMHRLSVLGDSYRKTLPCPSRAFLR